MTIYSQMRIRILRRGADAHVELPWGPVLIGSGSHCDVRLLPDEAAERQLSVEPSGAGLRVKCFVREPRCTYQGLPFEEIVLSTPAQLELAGLTLIVELVCDATPSKSDRGNKLKTVRQCAMLVALAIGYYWVLREPEPESSARSSVPKPSMFEPAPVRACPQTDVAAARALAEEQFVLAESKRERSPFRVHDGVLAVPLYETAAACFAQAQAVEWAEEARECARQLRRELGDKLHTHQVRLDWFLGRHKYEAARAEVVVLRELLRGRSDPYSQWLASIERELSTTIAAQKTKES